MGRTAVLLSMALMLFFAGVAQAEEQAEQDKAAKREAALKMKKGQDLIEAAARIVEAAPSREAKALLKASRESYSEASKRYNAGEHGQAAKGFSDSIQSAINAVMLSNGRHEEGARFIAMQEAEDENAKHDQDRTKAMLEKATVEADAFIEAAGRLASGNGGSKSERLEGARQLYVSSKTKSDAGDYGGALRDMTGAYELATAAIKEMNRSRGEALTFPQKSLTDPKDLLAYEVNKNDTYAFFASRTVGEDEKDSIVLLRAAKKARGQAQRSIDKGDGAKAIERLRQSTGLYIQAIRKSGE